MSEPKRWTVPASVCPAALGNGYPEVNVIAAEDFDRLRDERDFISSEARKNSDDYWRTSRGLVRCHTRARLDRAPPRAATCRTRP